MQPSLATIRARRQQIAEQRELLRLEDEELAMAEGVLARLAGESSVRVASNDRGVRSRIAAPRSQRELVLDALECAPQPWLRGREIIALARERWGVVIPEKSLRPLLTNMKNARVIVREGRRVALRNRARETSPVEPAPTQMARRTSARRLRA